MNEYQISLERGEPYSRGERRSQRTRRHRGANAEAQRGEPGSPESSLTVINRHTRANPPGSPDGEAVCEQHQNHLRAVTRVWDYYIQKLQKQPKLLSFTSARKNKGMARLRDALEKTAGDLVRAEELMKLAIDNLAASSWHTGDNPSHKRYDSWERNLFSSTEQFERWLDAPPAGGRSNSTNVDDAAAAAMGVVR
jgi:hypothetical protein